jgi:hypothetical protein
MTEPANSRILIICSSEDREWKDRILGLLTGRGMGDRLEVWENGNRAGTTGGWLGEYNQAIEHAGVVVPLISPQFVAYQKSVERPEIHLSLQARGSSGSPIYPILLRPSDWEGLGWLQHNTIYPENGLALSNVDADEIDARLVLIGLEIGARAFVPGLLNSMSAKLLLPAGTFGGMVTLINPAVAVSVPQGDPTDDRPRTLVVETGIMVQTIQAAVVGRDPSLDCCLFRLIPPSQATLPPTRFDLPSPGSTWECLTFTSDDSPVEFATGTVVGATTRNGREYLHLRPIPEAQTPQGMSGAPIVVDGHLVGVLASEGAILNEWFALPVKSIAASPLGAAIWPPETRTAGTEATQPPSQTAAGTQHPPDFDQADFLARLGSAARDSLARAEGLRTALGQDRLHIDHLILGLYGRPDSPMRRLAREAGIQGLKGLLDLLSPWNAQLSSSADRVDLTPGILPIPFDSLPTLSAHVQRAIAFAWNHVRSSGVRTLGRRHLTDGIFSLDDCPVVQAFRERLPKAVSPTIRVVPEQDWLPGVVSDWPGEKDPDLLNLKRDVHAICSVIAAQDAALPLSIGLFGDWGSGKSFFMKEMEQKIRELEKKGPPSYCSNIVQLKFNAWHYIDTNLWASLTSEIFEGLVTALSRQPVPSRKMKRHVYWLKSARPATNWLTPNAKRTRRTAN